MAKKCIQCGHENEDNAFRCVCGGDLTKSVAMEPVSTEEAPDRSGGGAASVVVPPAMGEDQRRRAITNAREWSAIGVFLSVLYFTLAYLERDQRFVLYGASAAGMAFLAGGLLGLAGAYRKARVLNILGGIIGLPIGAVMFLGARSMRLAAEASAATRQQNDDLREAVFLLWGIAFVPVFALARSLLHVGPPYRILIGTGVFAASAVAAFWLLGREKRLALRVWRIVFVVWALLVLPLLLNVAQGVAEEGWPRGRFNRQVARLLVLILVLTIPGFLTGLCALIKTYRLASGLALATGLTYLVDGVLLLRAASPAQGLQLELRNVLDIILFGTQMGGYLSIPMGIVLIVGGIMTLRAARARPPSGAT